MTVDELIAALSTTYLGGWWRLVAAARGNVPAQKRHRATGPQNKEAKDGPDQSE
jgi:hypothetical protein